MDKKIKPNSGNNLKYDSLIKDELNMNESLEVNHINGNPINNDLDNLEIKKTKKKLEYFTE